MAKADAEDGDIGIQQFLNHRHGIFARRGGVARTIGKEYASRLLLHDIFEGCRSRKDCHLCARTTERSEERRVGEERVRTGRTRGEPITLKIKKSSANKI